MNTEAVLMEVHRLAMTVFLRKCLEMMANAKHNILDFSTWRDDARFASTFNKLIDGLELFYKKT